MKEQGRCASLLFHICPTYCFPCPNSLLVLDVAQTLRRRKAAMNHRTPSGGEGRGRACGRQPGQRTALTPGPSPRGRGEVLVNILRQFQFAAVHKLLWGTGEGFARQEVLERGFTVSLLCGRWIIVGSSFGVWSWGDGNRSQWAPPDRSVWSKTLSARGLAAGRLRMSWWSFDTHVYYGV
jgi:hypothetical protein